MKKMIITLACLTALTAQAIPAWRGWQQRTLANGHTVECRLLGDEHCHAYIDKNGKRLLERANDTLVYSSENGVFDFAAYYEQQTGRRSSRRVLGGGFPTQGAVKGLVLLVQFADNAFQEEYTRQVFDNAMNLEGCRAYGATGSSRDYFISQSWGQFTPQFDVVGPITLSRTMKYYGSNDSQGNDRHPGDMVSEACKLAHDSLQVDFSQYDYNNDGDVDFVYVIYAGYAESYGASSNTIWPHAANLTDMHVYESLDGKRLQRYACSSELKYTTGTQLEGIGTFCHEFGHVLGLPDMYNTRQTQNVQMGVWDIMDQGSYNNDSHTPPSYSAFERASLGWMTLTELDTPSDSIVLPELNESRMAYRITTAANPDEYFTLENRQQKQWDAYQPGRGMMVIHVDYDEQTWNRNGVNAGVHPCYDLVESDGTQGSNTSGDLYPAGNDMLTDYSVPNMLAWDGTPTEKGITHICLQSDGNVSFKFMRDRLKQPKGLAVTEVSDTAFILQWNAVDEATAYRIDLSEQLTDAENPVLLNEDFSLMGGEGYPKSGFDDISSQLNNYTHQSGWTGSAVYEAGGSVRVGGYGVSGVLTSPAIYCPTDTLAVAYTAQSYPGKNVSYTVEVAGQSYDMKATKTPKDTLLFFTATAGKDVQVRFATNRERLFISRLRLLRNCVSTDSAWVWMDTETKWTLDSLCPDNLTAPSWHITGLKPLHRYTASVTALTDDANRTSAASDIISIETTDRQQPSALEYIYNDNPVLRREYFDLQGRRVSAQEKGITLCRRYHADGMVSVIKQQH